MAHASSLLPSFAALLFALGAAPVRAGDRTPSFGVGTSVEKLRPDDALPGASGIELEAPRGACVSAQVAVKPARPLGAFTASAMPLVPPTSPQEDGRAPSVTAPTPGRTGSPVPTSRPTRAKGIVPTLYRVAAVELARSRGPEGGTGSASGSWPDPPAPERYALLEERRHAFPVSVRAGQLQAVWVELCVPEEAMAGSWRGFVRLADGDRELGVVPVELEVWPYALGDGDTFT